MTSIDFLIKVMQISLKVKNRDISVTEDIISLTNTIVMDDEILAAITALDMALMEEIFNDYSLYDFIKQTYPDISVFDKEFILRCGLLRSNIELTREDIYNYLTDIVQFKTDVAKYKYYYELSTRSIMLNDSELIEIAINKLNEINSSGATV